MKYFILIDADNFIKKHFITKEKTDSAHPPPHPGPHCLKSSQDVPWLGGGGGGCNKQDILRQTSELHTAQSEMWQFSLVQRCRPGPGQGALTALRPTPTLATLDTGHWELREQFMPNVWLHSTVCCYRWSLTSHWVTCSTNPITQTTLCTMYLYYTGEGSDKIY